MMWTHTVDAPSAPPAVLLVLTLLLATSLSGCLFSTGDVEEQQEVLEPLRMNHIQVKGTHNSYHLKPLGGDLIAQYNYSHAPLATQAQDFQVRQFEIDVWFIPGFGLRVYHNPYDSRSTCAAFSDCLADLKNWSDANPAHVPLWVMVEPKDHELVVSGVDILERIEADIDSVWPRERRVQPDDVRGNSTTLRAAVMEGGWPILDDVRGKAAFALLDKSEIRDAYVQNNPGLENATMFVVVEEDAPEAALISWTDPESKGDVLRSAVEAGFIVRTRPDSDTTEAQQGNYSRFDLALASGAHMLSTDFPGNDDEVGYAIWIPDGPVRCNPLTAPAHCTSAALESL